MLNTPLKIGALTIPNRVILAPLAGVTDQAFRRICQEMGAGLTYIEMLSASALNHHSRGSEALLARHASEPLLGVQITGPTAESVGEGVRRLEAWNLDTVDINMGCPVRKIVATNAGSAILRDPDRVGRTVEFARSATARPVTAKIRLGYSERQRNVEEVVRRLAAAGVAMVTIHGRTREDRYNVPVDFGGIAAGVAAARAEVPAGLPVIGNGDILEPHQAGEMIAKTGCDGVMISRGALGNPWIFRQILEPGTPQPTVLEWRAVLERHVDYHYQHHGTSEHATHIFRKHLIWYASGFPQMRRLREALNSVNERKDIIALLDRTLEHLPPELRRYADS